MRVILSETQLNKLNSTIQNLFEAPIQKSNEPLDKRVEIVGTKIIELMDKNGFTEIPNYSFFEGIREFKNFMYKYLNKGEYSAHVLPFIKRMKPEFTYSPAAIRKKFILDDGVVVLSWGEVITYNTFKMNGIKLIFEDPSQNFQYEYNGEILTKIPDFYWPEQNILIEVAGLRDMEAFGGNYERKLQSAQKKLEKENKKLVILRYIDYLKRPKDFYRYICETFNFPYDENKFWSVIRHQTYDEGKLRKKAEELILKQNKTRQERDQLSKIINRDLRSTQDDSGEDEQGYSSVWDFRKQTGVGMRWADEETKKQIQKSWCESTGGTLKTYEKFKELFPDVKVSKTTIENVKRKFPNEFDLNKRDEICSEYNKNI